MIKEDLSLIRELSLIQQDEISSLHDLDSLLDKILFEARKFTHADAGSVFLVEGDHLKFSYVQNDSLFKHDITNNKFLYSNHELIIDEKSIAGYVALTNKSLNINNAYQIDSNSPYSFNSSYDETSSYLTRSILTIPLKTGPGKIVGVMQIINALNKNNEPASFTPKHQIMADLFANTAATAIERAKLTRTIILRMIKMAELRDPKETGAHVNRVGSYAIEIYHKWASTKGISEKEIKNYKDILRLSAMLHDVGKVAISDMILKKPGKLTEDEFNTMKYHTIAGTKLFEDPTSKLDYLSAEIALNHHEKWNGKGYPGKRESDDSLIFGPGKKGKEIPLSGRIVALADVYDALISSRCYKDAWPEESVLKLIEEQAGNDFDPEVVESFFAIYDVIEAIRKKFPG